MEQLSTVVWGFFVVITILTALGVGAMIFGADSRPCIGDEHTGSPRTDWI